MQTWIQRPFTQDVVLRKAEGGDEWISMDLLHAPSGLEVRALLQLDRDLPEFTVVLSAKGRLRGPLSFPHPFLTAAGTYLVIPMNEGISYPVEDRSVSAPVRLIAYGGDGICMPFWGVTNGERGHMVIIETPDDAAIRMDRIEGRLCVCPEWDPQKDQFGYDRRLRYVFFDRGGYVAMCKRYRIYAQDIGLFRTLAQKRQENPNVDLLLGAVDIWFFDDIPLPIVNEMRSLGFQNILWSNAARASAEDIKSMNAMKILTSRYDIYENVMNPENFKYLGEVHPDWPTEAWPKDIILASHGDWIRGWQVQGKDGQWYACGVMCDSQAVKYAMKRIPDELKTRPYRCRFIDTSTCSPWYECYSPDHPMTRTQSRSWRMKLLRYASANMSLVTGSENGQDAAVPYVHYFEGMMSLVPYRIPNAGRNIGQIYADASEQVTRFQVGHQYRLPLWELVYHDCVVSHWFWGDCSNNILSIWDKRDLFNILYGTPPMFVLTSENWQQYKTRFVKSYQNVCPVVRAVGYSEMIDHRFLTQDRKVQQTVFANGITITVNFGDTCHVLADGATVLPMGFRSERTGCMIASVAYGSDLAPEVQFLREFRDQSVQSTFAGKSFMKTFNSFYYSFSPTVASVVAENPALLQMVRLLLYPLIAALRLASRIFDIPSFSHELSAVVLGIVVAALVGTAYLTPILAAAKIRARRARRGN